MNLLNNKPTLQLTSVDVAVLRDFQTLTENLNPQAVTLLLEDIAIESTDSTHFNIQYVENGKFLYVATARTDEFGLVNLGVFSTREKAKESIVYYENNNSSKSYDDWNEFFRDYCRKETFILDFDISEELLDVM